jgi:hypothetical protein
MLFGRHLLVSSLIVFSLFSIALAQAGLTPTQPQIESLTPAPLVTATATAVRVRFVAPGTVVQLRLEVFNETGQKVFDSELRGGNVLDWHLQNGTGERLQPGSYASVLTIKSLSGRLSQRVGLVTLNNDKASIEVAAETALLTPAQQQAVGPVEENSVLTVLHESEAPAATVVAHDGRNGEVTSTQGALTFRTGDIFSGLEIEHMRITPEGRIGIGTAAPEATLDINGTLRARGGIKFDDGTVLTSMGGAARTGEDGTPQPLVAGTGTPGRLTKWVDAGGTLGDSVVTENVSGFVGIGTASPEFPLHIEHPTYAQAFVSGGTAADFLMYHRNAPPNARFFGLRSQDGRGKFSSFNDNRSYRIEAIIAWDNATGDVGIGTVNPVAKLDVVGNINTSTQYNIGGSRVLSVAGTNNVFAGIGAGSATPPGSDNSFFGRDAGTNTQGSYNSFFGLQAGASNTGSGNNSFFGARAGFANTGTYNSFFGSFSGTANTSGSSNSFFGERSGSNSQGVNNSFFGAVAGQSNVSGGDNTIIGAQANVGSGDLINATAIGYGALVSQSNSLVLGNGVNVGIGTTAPSARLHVAGVSSAVGTPVAIVESSGNQVPLSFRSGATEVARIRSDIQGNLVFATLNGTDKGIFFRAGDDSTTDMYIESATGNVGIATGTPDHTLTVNGTADKPGGGSWDSFSDERLKTIKGRFTPGLKAVMQLQPLRYEYKPDNALGLRSSGEHIGFGAQAVQKIIPEAVSKNDRGYLLVNNDPILWTMLNAIKEQQHTIEQLRQENKKLNALNADSETRLAAVETTVKRMAQNKRRQHRRK